MKRFIVLSAILGLFAAAQPAWAGFSTTAFGRIPSSLSGLSGLLFTQSIDTLAPGKFEAGLGLIQEESHRPEFSTSKLLSTFAVGVTRTIEVSAQVPYFSNVDAVKIEGNRITQLDESGTGDVNLSIKWRFLESNHDLNLPGFAFSFTVFFPTGQRDLGLGSVDAWGLRALIISSAELEIISFSPYSIPFGVYADGGVYAEDLGDDQEKETHGLIDLGLLIPLNTSMKLQLLLEGNARINQETPFGGGYTATTVGLRYVSRHLSLNAGWQHRFNKNNSKTRFDDSERFILYGSYDF